MSDALKERLWIGAFVLVTLAPMLILFIGPRPEGREFWRELSAAWGFAGLSLMGMQFIPTARLPFLASVFPMDTLYTFHRRISIAGFTLALAHPLILFIGNPYTLRLLNLTNAPWRARAAVLSVILFILLVASSVWRKDFKIRYERWRTIHGLFAVVAAGLVLYHIFMVNHYLAHPLQRGYWVIMAAVWAAATLYVRVLRPLQLLRRPYRVIEVRPERGEAWTLALAPDGHAGMRFMAGQFAWLTARTSPFSFRDNPFSFNSSAEVRDRLEFTIKELGDFTRTIKEFQPGEKVYVDGPFGTFDIDQHEAPGYVMIAGGIGSVPVLSILRTMADRKDTRPVVFFYGNPDWESVTYREDLETLQERMNLKVVHLLENPPEGWQGETGYITREILERHLPADHAQWQYFICGPIPMITAVEKKLVAMGVSLHYIHTENYEMA
ncbi:MAG: ferric reductase-like transmembrane domain-containing protein [candidate division KSB1 bacterium]|nr:ferric reductase-like transmembrane domain-containing protein [candidate division KSB1 bacterium]MDZ7364566.1 ferric reductase-like transmembrane domain-containing protein [candidate division KSB1 bacterium]MDZ7402686.1 ferric reductase-like transmembrane domain-containing protein [candidate division KSB1 bacterium]